MRRITRNAGFLLGGEVATRVLGFLVSAILAHRLGVAGFGQVGFAMSIMAYGVMASKFGLVTLGIRESARDHDRLPHLAGRLVGMRLLLGFAALALICVFALLVRKEPDVKWLLVIFAVGVPVQAVLLEWAFIGMERMGYVAIARLINYAVYFGVVAILVRGPDQILFVPVGLISGMAAAGILLFIVHATRHQRLRIVFSREAWRSLFPRAFPIGIASILTQLHVNSGIVGLALLATDEAAGIFTSAHRIVFFTLMLDRVFQSVFLPAISRIVKSDRAALPMVTGTAIRVILAISLPVCAGTVLLGQQALVLVFGVSYAVAAPTLQVLVWFFPLSMLSSLAGQTLLAAGKEKRFARNTTIGVSLGIVLSVAGILLWGPVGAAFAMLAGELCILLFMGRDFLAVVRPKPGIRLAVSLLALVPMVAAMTLLKSWNWAWAAVAGVVGYGAVLVLLRGLTPADLGLRRPL